MEEIIFKGILQFDDKSTYGQKVKSQQSKQSYINKKCSENKKLYSQSESSEFQKTTTVTETAIKPSKVKQPEK